MESDCKQEHWTAFEQCVLHFSGTIHDVKNLMCAVINTADFLAMDIPASDPCSKKLQMIVQLTQKSITLLSSSQLEVSGYNGGFKPVELIPLLDEVISMIEYRKDNNISVELTSNGLHPIISGNKIELESALLNLCINAIESMSGTGSLRIDVSTVGRLEKPDICNIAKVTQNYIQIAISDTGCGIAPEKLPFIFNHFYSTKQSSSFTQRGLGLFRVKQCVGLHGGTIEVKSILSQGTIFIIRLPALDG